MKYELVRERRFRRSVKIYVFVQVAAARHCQSGGVTARLGHSLNVADVNGDSIPDVIVGAPGR